MDEQDVRGFAKAHPEVLAAIIGASAERLHAEDNLFGEAFTIAMFVALCKSLSEVIGAGVAVAKVIGAAEKLIGWAHQRLAADADANERELTIGERILILAFEAFLNRKIGIKAESVSKLLGVDEKSVMHALEQLQINGIIRKARDGSWKYVRPF
ncbi:hypothetical protein GCM10011611_02530 [Aliidongia dinghuensis]|uniref:Uncharacterized protein n=2 Tax=Aliidongia dinghuensis TaxID=1867774 RepID=A0A8J2YNX6_9PROT|nr:hypothetical protein GCM10011611_02530 [Aliidongia dinghuensis]